MRWVLRFFKISAVALVLAGIISAAAAAAGSVNNAPDRPRPSVTTPRPGGQIDKSWKQGLLTSPASSSVSSSASSSVAVPADNGGIWNFQRVLQWLKKAVHMPRWGIKKVIVNGSKETKDDKPVVLYKPVIDYEQSVISVVEEASPGVVSIIINKDLPVVERCIIDPFSQLSPDLRQLFGADLFNISQSCDQGKTQRQEIGGGTGFIIDKQGLIATNKHIVLDKKADYTVLTNNGKKYPAQIIAVDRVQDLTILKIEAPPDELKPLRLGNSDEVKLGQTAITIGNALGQFRNTVSVGVVSGLARKVDAGGPGFSEILEGVIQTDAAINPGNSGGPLLNLKGEVIGINVAMVSGAENIGFSIPINKLKKAIVSVKTTGRIVTPYLGVRYLPVSEELAKRDQLPVNYGALLRGTEEGPAIIKDSPADKAGLRAEDIVLEVNGEKIKEGNLSTLIQKQSVGSSVTLKVRRGNQELIISVQLEELKA